MPRKCGACGEYGHNKRTCSSKIEAPSLSDNPTNTLHTDNIVWKIGQKINVKYPWDSFWVSTEVVDVDPDTGNVTLICLKKGCFYGLNLSSLEKYGIAVRRT
jgi:hypothetical protein